MAGEEMINLIRLEDYNNNMLRDAHILKRSTAYAVDDKVNKGLIYLKCTQAGTTASTALSLSGVSVGDTLTDGSVIWKVLSIKGVPEGGGTGAGLEDWESNHDYAVDDIYVYEGEIYKTLIAFTSGATEDSRTKVNNIVPSVWAANTAYTAGDIIEHTDVTTLKKVYYSVTDDFTSGATFEVTAEMQELQIVEEYVPIELTDDDIKEIVSAYNPVFEEAKGINYSTEEQRIGTWIDGKPLYQITYNETAPSTINTPEEIAELPANVDSTNVVDAKFILHTANGYIYLTNFYLSTNDMDMLWIRPNKKIVMQVGATVHTNATVYITIQYTKTTD